ncbi:hypothetical protein JGI7_00372 [Candidatus Kryptonium thompsonii]|uniref:LPP20 lipoprotein n=1 Tax=Candidatus Kryptonium thompsonii TaxID=1633631 RepID=A0A0P1L749_9BACT|nr:DUF6175 family protein [Candidatus Kryptonium thompsoni]CUS76892.1 hypothetical protein JGI12_00058 [Candidatus Kryptonium thompsoni]CUS80016.1 hypothetical protein JGI7_00372 [Candidatus Kryptonium thompsoni]CUS80537.1 hypothetical protein JGI13_00560 [Candidatus Kryptonium thompsoni]CUS84995.1 hypothetical protein JGI10_01077 [Candidatus Kryptonium thompsoni]CUS89760.1 hypothetical protein JGI15_105214 [Candidatus Kryptonium thompsoni]
MKRKLLLLLLLPLICYSQKNLPISREATFIESYSPSEVTIRASGIGKNNTQAELDGRRAAVWYVLIGATDAILQTPEEKKAFESVQDEIFDERNIAKYISFETTEYESRVKLADGRVKITKYYRVNKKLLTEDLVAKNIIKPKEEITEAIGLPFIMVVPEAPKGVSPIDLLRSDRLLKKGAEVIESYLTARKYDVQVPEQMETLSELAQAQAGLKGIEEDYAYQLALAIGSDVYITYNVKIERRYVGSTEYRKAVVAARAYETTTARLLGTETGYSGEYAVPEEAVVEEAMNDAIDKVLSRIMAYWKDDLTRGLQFKLLFRITGNFDEDTHDEILMATENSLKKLCNRTKQNVVTDQTMDYIVWVDPKKYNSPLALFRDIRKQIESAVPVKVKRINANRKLLVLEITE